MCIYAHGQCPTGQLCHLRLNGIANLESMIAKLESMIAKLERMIDNFGVNHSNNSWTTGTNRLNEYKHSTYNLT
jgi:hypothetical protein